MKELCIDTICVQWLRTNKYYNDFPFVKVLEVLQKLTKAVYMQLLPFWDKKDFLVSIMGACILFVFPLAPQNIATPTLEEQQS